MFLIENLKKKIENFFQKISFFILALFQLQTMTEDPCLLTPSPAGPTEHKEIRPRNAGNPALGRKTFFLIH